jgi:cell division protease FtsH
MSDLGPIQYGRGNHQVFLGRDLGEERNYSEEVASKIDAEVRRIIESCYGRGKQILTDNWDKVERMVGSLLEYETVEAEEVRAILSGRPYSRKTQSASPPPPAPPSQPVEEPKRTEPRIKPKISPEPA